MRYGQHQSRQERLPLWEFLHYDLSEPAPEKFIWYSLFTYNHRHELVYRQPLFIAPAIDSWLGQRDIAPNGEYFFISDKISEREQHPLYLDANLFWKRGHPMPNELDVPGLFIAKFSPDSRRLVGFSHEDRGFYAVECSTGKLRQLFRRREHRKANRFAYCWGWYADSRHVWYFDYDELFYNSPKEFMQRSWEAPIFFKLDTRTGKRQRMDSRERYRAFHDWDLLDPSWRYAAWREMDGDRAFVYSTDHRVRVQVKPFFKPDRPPYKVGQLEIFLEWREGKVKRIIGRGEHEWVFVLPAFITDDGRWLLLDCEVLVDGDHHKTASETVVIDTRSGRRYVYREADRTAPYPRQARNNPYEIRGRGDRLRM